MNELSRKSDWKSIAYVIGGIVGLVVGLLSAHLYSQAVEENQTDKRPNLGTGELFTIGMAALSLVRQVTDLGARNPKKR